MKDKGRILISVLTAVFVIQGAYAVEISDDFQAETLKGIYEPVEGRWMTQAGSLTGRGGKQNRLVVNAPDLSVEGPVSVDADIMIENPAGEKSAMGIYLCFEDEQNYALLRFRGGEANLVQLISKAGSKSKVKSFSEETPLQAGVWYHLNIQGDGNGRYEVTLSEKGKAGTVMASGHLSTFVRSSKGRLGFYLSQKTRGSFDNFSVKTQP